MPVKITPYEAANGYEDHYVSRGRMAFSFLSDDDIMVGPFVDCKDYLQNRIHGFLLGKPGMSQYKYQPSKMAGISTEKTRLLVCRKDVSAAEFESEVKLALDLLHPLEKDLGLLRSTYDKVTGAKKGYGPTLLVEGSKKWMLAPPMISLYTLLLRNAKVHHKLGRSYLDTLHDISELGGGELGVKVIKHLVKSKYWKVFGKEIKANYPEKVGEDMMHSMGFNAFGKCLNTNLWPHWLFLNTAVTVKKAKEK